MRTRVFTTVLTLIVGIVIGAGAAVYAQLSRPPVAGKTVITLTDAASGQIITNGAAAPTTPAEVKLFVVGHRDGRVVGTLMAKENGRWVEVQLATQNTYVGR